MGIWSPSAPGQQFCAEARHPAPLKLTIILGKYLGAPEWPNIGFALRQERFAGLCRVLFDKESRAGGADEIDTPQTAMDRLAPLGGFGGMANAYDCTQVLLGEAPQRFEQGPR